MVQLNRREFLSLGAGFAAALALPKSVGARTQYYLEGPFFDKEWSYPRHDIGRAIMWVKNPDGKTDRVMAFFDKAPNTNHWNVTITDWLKDMKMDFEPRNWSSTPAFAFENAIPLEGGILE